MNKNLTLRTETLILRKETLRQLDRSLLSEVQGGALRSQPSCGGQPTSHQSQHSSRY